MQFWDKSIRTGRESMLTSTSSGTSSCLTPNWDSQRLKSSTVGVVCSGKERKIWQLMSSSLRLPSLMTPSSTTIRNQLDGYRHSIAPSIWRKPTSTWEKKRPEQMRILTLKLNIKYWTHLNKKLLRTMLKHWLRKRELGAERCSNTRN